MISALERVETGLRIALVTLSVGLVAAIAGGVLLKPPAPVGFPAVEGRSLLRQSGVGPAVSTAEPVRFRQHEIGVAVRCDGTGTIRVDLDGVGAVESNCAVQDMTDGGYVLSDISPSTRSTSWTVRTRAENRWSLVLTQPVTDGVELLP